MQRLPDMSGLKFGRLSVVCKGDIVSGNVVYDCVCDCGKKTSVKASALKSGNTKSCGCLRKDITSKRFKKHNLKGTPEYCSWRLMKDRCLNKNNKTYSYYGGKGITVCDQWLNDPVKFAKDMGLKPEPAYTLDRIDPSKEYSPENCRWASKTTQSRNRSDSNLITLSGITKHILDWCDEIGVNYSTARYRQRKGLSAEQILKTI